ncbi:DNA polymerase eta [Manduca sexta]|uniref:DNA polymerase eta n=1 Tax=Manduca sexta TaxID=7130 RepID=A0A922CJ19_MANSE|nr:DNA polymerase eta [Manduca sexta]KAG6448685.1 hypothetical protein O3G_MSEX005653 [Manduca sexta]
MDSENRVVVLIDMDCFYCQVEEKLNPELKGKPIAVVQYNPWKGGGIIAVNYVARAMGVTRHMRGDEAKEKCPEIQLPSVPCQRGKADITKYRDAGKEVAKVLQKFTSLLERASIDEAYLDITAPVQQRLKNLNINTITASIIPNTYALGYDCVEEFLADVHTCGAESIDFDYEHAQHLLIGAVIVSEIRAAVYNETGYRCSAGIAHNKILAKLVCGMNKPNKQTILPKHSINILYNTLSLKKVKHLGGKFGDIVCDTLKIKTMAELQRFTERELQAKFEEKNGTWLYNIARGTDLEPVQARFNPKSIGCCKQLRGKSAVNDLDSLKKWLRDLGDEIEDRLEKDALENNRTPKQMVVSYSVQLLDGRDTSSSRSYNFVSEDELCGELLSNKALELLLESSEGCKPKDGEANRKLKAPIKFLGISVGKFEDNCDAKKTKKIKDYFGAGTSKDKVVNKENAPESESEAKPNEVQKKPNKNCDKDYILKKFFQTNTVTTENTKSVEPPDKSVKSDAVFESSLYKQESFFAKMLNGKLKQSDQQPGNNECDTPAKPTTPVCDVVQCGENSNDTDYSSSTINNEINKSIALFEDDPQDDIRVKSISSIRELLKTKVEIDNEPETENNDLENPANVRDNTEVDSHANLVEKIETFDCPECGKKVAIDQFETHSDYHLALKLRDEDRQQMRKDKVKVNAIPIPPAEDKRKKKKTDEPVIKNDTKSLANFLVKLNDNIVTEMCSECGKKIPVEKFAEHLDFHEAQRLNRQLNKKATPLFITSSAKRRKKSESPVKKTKIPCKSIDSFFK